MSAPDILAEIKQDLGVPADDASSDAYLTRRIAAVWARMEQLTARALCVPPQAFTDDWTRIIVTAPNDHYPPFQQRTTVFLRYFPVVSIEAVESDSTPGDAAGVRFDPKSGKLFSLTGQVYAQDLSAALWRTKITYKAGWAEIPPDLYEIVLGAVGAAWNARSGGGTGAPGTVTSINVVDVGSVDVAAGNPFVQAAAKGGGAIDPLLGPYASMLNGYIDHRSLIGSAMFPVTEPVPVAVTKVAAPP